MYLIIAALYTMKKANSKKQLKKLLEQHEEYIKNGLYENAQIENEILKGDGSFQKK